MEKHNTNRVVKRPRKRCLSPQNTESSEYSDQNETYRSKASLCGRINKKKDIVRKYAGTSDGHWDKNIKFDKFMEFHVKQTISRQTEDGGFDDSVDVLCALEVNENTVDRYLDTMNWPINYLVDHRRACDVQNLTPLIPGSDAYKITIRRMAMNHLLSCLEQGVLNEEFIEQQRQPWSPCDRLYSSSQGSDKDPAVKTLHSEEAGSTNDTGLIAEKDIKWTVERDIIVQGKKLPAFSSPPIDPRDCPFLHPALMCLQPILNPSEPFMLFGIGIRCADLKDIFFLDGCDRAFDSEFEVHPVACEIISFFKGINDDWCKSCNNPKKNSKQTTFIDNFLAGLSEYIDQNGAAWIQKKQHFKQEKSEISFQLFRQLDIWYKEEPARLKTELVLQTFAALLLAFGGYCNNNALAKTLDLFRKKTNELEHESAYTTHVEYSDSTGPSHFIIPLVAKIWKSEMRNIMDEHDRVELVNMRTVTAWQVFEQLLAAMLAHKYPSDTTFVYQGGLLLVDNQVRTTVLSMHVEVYNRLKELNQEIRDVKETLRYIKNYSGVAWCKLYIEKDVHSIWDILERAKITLFNFY